ncbi:hypothetical protein Tco_0520698 [Tanacetum coccineum]
MIFIYSSKSPKADGAQRSRVSVPLPDDPYVAVRQAQLVDTYTESDPEEAPFKANESQPLGSRLPLVSVGVWVLAVRTARMTVCAHPAMSLVHLARVAEVMTFLDSAFRKRYRSSYETPSPSLTLPVQKRHRGTSELILDTDSEGDELGDEDTNEDEEDESLGMDDEREREREEEEEVVPEGQQQAVLVVDTTASWPVGLGYGALRRCEIAMGED